MLEMKKLAFREINYPQIEKPGQRSGFECYGAQNGAEELHM